MEEYDIDPQVLSGFIDETVENLEAAEQMFIHLEEEPDNVEIINTIFRPVHSLKGTSGFFGLIKTKELAHSMENLLDAIRKGEKKATREVINVLLPGIDQLNLIFQRIRTGQDEVENLAEYDKVKDQIEQTLTLEITETDIEKKRDSEVESPSESSDILGELIERLYIIRPIIPENQVHIIDDAMDIFFRMSADNEAQEDEAEASKFSEPIACTNHDDPAEERKTGQSSRHGKLYKSQTKKTEDKNLDPKDTSKIEIGTDSSKQDRSRPVVKSEPDQDRKEKTGEDIKNRERRKEDRRKGDRREIKSAEADKTMRVSEKSIDSFLEYVGELVVVEEMFNYLQKRLASLSLDHNISKNFRQVIETFSSLSDNLRNSILEIRSVPAQMLLQKAPRIIRMIADAAGKMVDVTIEGENIRIDKSYLELLDAPLTHMVRNAVDHGIETPSERTAAGKAPKGSIRIAVQETRENIELVVSEDGKGLDLDAISNKAAEMGIITDGQKLEESNIIELLFMSGVSTAREITDISGRGVGMDVVKKNIDSAGGFISVETRKGYGTTFRITLPKSISTQIVDGFLVKSGNETYVLPMELIGESFVPGKNDISTVSGGRAQMVLRRGELMPVVHFETMLGMIRENSNIPENNRQKVMITINMDENSYALCVDDILGVQKVVIKNVEALPVEKNYFDGAAMMGDGSVAMIISVDGLKKVTLQ